MTKRFWALRHAQVEDRTNHVALGWMDDDEAGAMNRRLERHGSLMRWEVK